MNKKENNLMLKVVENLSEVRTNIKWIKTNVKEHNEKLDEIVLKIAEVETGFKNHLKEHEKLRRDFFIKAGILITVVTSVISWIIGMVM